MRPSPAGKSPPRGEQRAVRWVLLIVTVYICLVFVLIGAAQSLVRMQPLYTAPISVDGAYELVVARYRPMPFGLAGRGLAPGEVRVINGSGRIVDSERVENVISVRDVRWGTSEVRFDQDRDGATVESTLDYLQ